HRPSLLFNLSLLPIISHSSLSFFFNAPAPTYIYTLSLHDALPICFFKSAEKTGLNPKEIQSAIEILQDKINFSRQIKAGDRFEIVVLREVTETENTGNMRIEGVRVHTNGNVVGAFLHDDGQYYNKNGQ